MPATYSLDLRRRVVAAVDVGDATQEQVAARFAVSLGWVRKLLGQRRRVGHLEPLGHRGGAPRCLDERAVEAMRAAVTRQPDIALEELRLRLRRREQVRVSVPTLYRVIKALGLPRKKRPSSPAKSTRKNAKPSASA